MKNLLLLTVLLAGLVSCKKEELGPNERIETCCMFIDRKPSDVPTYMYRYTMLGNVMMTKDKNGNVAKIRNSGIVYSNTVFSLNQYIYAPLSAADSTVK